MSTGGRYGVGAARGGKLLLSPSLLTQAMVGGGCRACSLHSLCRACRGIQSLQPTACRGIESLQPVRPLGFSVGLDFGLYT